MTATDYIFGNKKESEVNPETTYYLDRVTAEGGIITDLNWIELIYSKLKEMDLLNNLVNWTSAQAGLKKDANNKILKTYSLDLANNDLHGTWGVNTMPIFKNSLPLPTKKAIWFSGAQTLWRSLPYNTGELTLLSFVMNDHATSGSGSKTVQGFQFGSGAWGYRSFTKELNANNKVYIYTGDGSNFQNNVFLAGTTYPTNNTGYINMIIRRKEAALSFNDLNGENNATLTNNHKVTAERYFIGARQPNGDGNPHIGEVCESAFFNIEITDDQTIELRNFVNSYYTP